MLVASLGSMLTLIVWDLLAQVGRIWRPAGIACVHVCLASNMFAIFHQSLDWVIFHPFCWTALARLLQDVSWYRSRRRLAEHNAVHAIIIIKGDWLA